jgi:predicted dehydrogenase
LAYVCDVDGERLARAKDLGGKSPKAVADLRTILDDSAVDAVIVATPDHWHSPAAILACEAKKHVYCEKPCSHNVREGRLLVEAARRNDRVVQHGTQVRSTPMMIEAVRKLREGVIGDVLVAKVWNIQRRGSIGRGAPSEPPAGFDYDNWVGPATMIPYQANRVHGGWHWWYHFGTGDMGNDGVHDIDYGPPRASSSSAAAARRSSWPSGTRSRRSSYRWANRTPHGTWPISWTRSAASAARTATSKSAM